MESSSSSSSSVITPEDVLGTLMNDGTIDAIRMKIITQLKANEELKNTTIKIVEQSKVLNTHGAEKQTKRELFDALRQERNSSQYFPLFLSSTDICYSLLVGGFMHLHHRRPASCVLQQQRLE
ncbi:PREDICTED: uncharacterized protein LOC109174900 [Ipomoea nil]|uniref:uncharacterized protein LOC109174900 n=1 Tax=Ipomoea nil TaxID=35883 RepID=UPI000901F138|nr:PREDICTED: uncharacterized protein LOC109174900 [Ipomoea nil]